MAKSLWNTADRDAIVARIDKLQASQAPLWGKMTASQMVKHCSVAFLGAMGDMSLTPKNTPFRNWPMRKLVIYVLPWPKGAPTAKELIITDDGDFGERKTALLAAIGKFAKGGPDQNFAAHAAFGELSGKDWGALMHRHLEHHLKQFGV